MSNFFRTSLVISICVLSILNSGCEEEATPADGTTPVSTTPCTGKVIFKTAVSNGNFGGAAGADIICNNNKPSGFSSSNFKALLTDNSRRACYTGSGNENCTTVGTTGRVDWVLPANSNICTTDAKLVGTTNANKYMDYVYPGVFSATATVTYTGFNQTWGQSATNCTQFASTSGTGIAGSGQLGLAGFYSSTIPNCTTAGTIYCVEQ